MALAPDQLPTPIRFAIAPAFAFALAVAFRPALAADVRIRRIALLALGCVMLSMPALFLPSEARLARAIEAIVSVTLLIKIYDLHVGSSLGHEPLNLKAHISFLLNPLALVERRLAPTPLPQTSVTRRRLARGVAIAAFNFVLLRYVWHRIPGEFVAEHVTKAVLAFGIVYGLMMAIAALWHLAGQRGPEFASNFFLSATPAEFWRRYNMPVRQFFHDNLFGQSRPRTNAGIVRSVLIVFVISGMLHEYLLVAAVGRMLGYELFFFVIQGIAVALTIWVRPSTRMWRVAAWSATMVFMLASSTLFFGGVNQTVKWYSDRAPAWLARR